MVTTNGTCEVKGLQAMNEADMRINGGFFIFKKKIFDYIGEREELVSEPFNRLIAEKQLIAYPYDGFWQSMDTFKDRQLLENMYANCRAPWQVWKSNGHCMAAQAG